MTKKKEADGAPADSMNVNEKVKAAVGDDSSGTGTDKAESEGGEDAKKDPVEAAEEADKTEGLDPEEAGKLAESLLKDLAKADVSRMVSHKAELSQFVKRARAIFPQ